ncbi:uncharacterized protein PV09_06908 [Verruconis gallopava]|uniref:BZIP domain-containing protein n=1 Tax=Verruconis gallopava TaxID=253628 RepID=A0A0D1XHL6_9PEZI|nr:uncharacterized protein PV09_06908 [Verruconis gallopava]KIW01731.1 hypothetical protein PV09_06908 [Verruconis gallopava]
MKETLRATMSPQVGSILNPDQQAEIRSFEEDWTGITSPQQRRKLQNRLNQRIWRRRHAKKGKNGNKIGTASELDFARNGVQQNVCCTYGTPNGVNALVRFEAFARHQNRLGSPRTDMLLTLIKFNVFRALMDINTMLGFSLEWLREDSISPFYENTNNNTRSDCPVTLRPTLLQQTVEHHPWIDLMPLPTMRDNILRVNYFDDTPLCHDIVDNRQCMGDWSGLIVWGDPWNPYNWEITESFAKNWAWVLYGCWELFESTNIWRAKRGEPKLFPEDMCTPQRYENEVLTQPTFTTTTTTTNH